MKGSAALGVFGVALLGAACSLTLYMLPPRVNMPPPGIPSSAWVLCFDQVERALREARAETFHKDIVSNREWACAQTYLIEACGRFLHKNGTFTALWRAGEVPYDFSLFRDHMRAYGANCEEDGYNTPFVQGLVRSFWDTIEREALTCPAICPVPET